uniref:Uncharacterized protein n=1 Tax=Rhipicephalus pulchellus TaxID=72859 RepID=L7LXS4_RHIPC
MSLQMVQLFFLSFPHFTPIFETAFGDHIFLHCAGSLGSLAALLLLRPAFTSLLTSSTNSFFLVVFLLFISSLGFC